MANARTNSKNYIHEVDKGFKSRTEAQLQSKIELKKKSHAAHSGMYEIAGVRCKTRLLDKPYQETGLASWYKGRSASSLDGKKLLTAAHRRLPMFSLVKVINVKNGRSVVVMINDKGPFVRGRVIDVCKEAAEILNIKRAGLSKVRLEYLQQETASMLSAIRSNSNTKSRSIAYQHIRSLSKLPHEEIIR
ncbi:septal ring lytic transglycosylase RlpA family protein [Candidatus Sarmatiella mevalonica]|uniref:septal ring lytic transglycosylase RlpA family protein n=1 Tax=Candidatus Sarmatiella mevalonica TaxID=2770581 RepID=UPI001924A3E4|nr:septal ring lytic transglycosylase RlpA family protein [Candidatus Sarmatiella mevalonica]